MRALLLSVDLEDVRDWVKNGYSYREAVPVNTRTYLEYFAKWGVRATFFVVGRVARRYPELIGEIVHAGHEIACHGDMHVQLDKLSPREFARDLQDNVRSLEDAGADNICGFRAPTFSLTQHTSWAHQVLSDEGFSYSSSVLPAASPLYGWPDFEKQEQIAGILELPITLHGLPGLNVPIAGGVYFRVLPFWLTRWAIGRKIAKGEVVGTYFHPYDIDTYQERFMHPDLNDKKHLNMLMYIGRAKVLKRLEVLQKSFPLQSYGEYVNTCQG